MTDNTEIRLVELLEQMKVANHRISDLEEATKKIETLTISVEKLAMSIEVMAKEQVEYSARMQEITSRLLEVENSPNKNKAERFDRYVGQIVSLIIGGLFSYLLFTLFGI